MDGMELLPLVWAQLLGYGLLYCGALVDRLANPNPQGYLRDIALDDIVKGKDAKGDNKDDWTPTGTNGSMRTQKIQITLKKCFQLSRERC